MRASAIWQHSLLHLASVGEQADTVSGAEGDFSQAECGVDREVEFAETSNAGTHQASSIEHQPDGLTAFDLKQTRDQFSAAGCSSPADVAKFITFAVFPQAFKFTASAADMGVAFFHFDLTAANQVHRLLPRLFEVRIHADFLFNARQGPAVGDPHRSLIADVHRAKFDITASHGNDLV